MERVQIVRETDAMRDEGVGVREDTGLAILFRIRDQQEDTLTLIHAIPREPGMRDKFPESLPPLGGAVRRRYVGH